MKICSPTGFSSDRFERLFAGIVWVGLIGLIGCTQSPNSITPPKPRMQFLTGSLTPEYPASRYFSDQWRDNPRANATDKEGYDTDYRMLAFRRLGEVPFNPPSGQSGHIEGVRGNVFNSSNEILIPGATVIRIPLDPTRPGHHYRDFVTSKEAFSEFQSYLLSPEAKFQQVEDKILSERKAAINQEGNRPRVVISGLGPAGLLSLLEAYRAGSTVIGVEKRQYTRPQILRLTEDTIARIKYFVGKDLWRYLRTYRGVVSQSPNWAYNRFDSANTFLVERSLLIEQMNNLLRENISLTYDIPFVQKLLSHSSTFGTEDEWHAFLQQYPDRKKANVEIIRINHLELILASIAERFAKKDPQHLRLYYGSSLEIENHPNGNKLKVEIGSLDHTHHRHTTVSYPLSADILVVTEGAGRGSSKKLGLRSYVISNTLYGATAALRLPVGFDVTLRPIENTFGTASVQGIARIDPEKLTLPGEPFERHTWTMIEEQDLCNELNDTLRQTWSSASSHHAWLGYVAGLHLSHSIDRHDVEFDCVHGISPPPSNQGGMHYPLPRTRYFFTGGIAYLGSELTEAQFQLFTFDQMHNQGHGLRDFMLTVTKKHMPREYISGQDYQHHNTAIHMNAKSGDPALADAARVVIVTEQKYSLSLFPVTLKKAEEFYKMIPFENRSVRVVQIGDSYATTHFFTGSGAVNGLRAASFFGKALFNGGSESDWNTASQEVSDATDRMHHKVVQGNADDSPLDGPFNQPIPPQLER